MSSVDASVRLGGGHTDSHSAEHSEECREDQTGPKDGSRLGRAQRGAHGSGNRPPPGAGAQKGRPAVTPTHLTPL